MQAPPSSSGPTGLDAWIERTHALEHVLGGVGRPDLLSVVATVREVLVDAKHEPPLRSATLPLVARALREIRACIVEPSRTLDAELVDELERLREPPRDSVPTTPAPFDPCSTEELLSSLGGMADASLVGLLANLGATKPKESDGLGTMRGVLVEGAAEHPILMKGELHAGLLTDLIQLFAQNSESGRLALQDRSNGAIASLFFERGQIVDATMGDSFGEDAFLRAASIRDGLFTYQRGISSAGHRITLPTRHLVFEALKVLDERRGTGAPPPTAQHRED
jgi:hypothetical protein